MSSDEIELAALQEQLADALSEVERLQSGLADAEARLARQREQVSELQSRLASAEEESVRFRGEAEAASSHLAETEAQLAQAVQRYREARLAANPEVPPDLVSGETIAEVDERFQSALKLVGELQDRLQAQSQSARVPIGSPPRRPPDYSGLSAQEKIRLGLERH